MKNRLCITLTDVNGSRQLALPRPIFRRFIVAILLCVGLLIVYPLWLNSQNSALKTSNVELLEQRLQSQQDSEQLQQKYRQALAELATKEDSLALSKQLFANLENQINYQTVDDLSDTERYDELSSQISFRQLVLQLLPNGKPSGYQRVTSSYGKRSHPVLKSKYLHKGIDLNSKMGTPVVATADGVVTSLQNTANGFGKLVKIRHAMGFTTYYGHLKTIAVDAHAFVSKGDVIGHSGNSGRSTGPHLHYEIRFADQAVDPAPFILWTLDNFEKYPNNAKEVPWVSLMASMQRLMAIQQPSSPKIVQSTANSTLTAACTSTAGCQAISNAQAPSPLASQGISMVK